MQQTGKYNSRCKGYAAGIKKMRYRQGKGKQAPEQV